MFGLQCHLADFSESQWVTCFQETAEAILGKTGDELGQMKEQVTFQDNLSFLNYFTEITLPNMSQYTRTARVWTFGCASIYCDKTLKKKKKKFLLAQSQQ